ncbi:MAG TPA: hypothetical protein VMX74_01510 [Pirellulales bacterium]|nr:hypothetical protein [Pirellulales bacterium]
MASRPHNSPFSVPIVSHRRRRTVSRRFNARPISACAAEIDSVEVDAAEGGAVEVDAAEGGAVEGGAVDMGFSRSSR